MDVRNQQVIKLFLVLIVCTFYIYGFSQYGVQAYDALWNKNSSFDEGTFIGSIDVSGKTKNEAVQIVKQQVEKWQSETEFNIHFKEKTDSFDTSMISFQIENSVNQAKQGQKNSLIAEIDTFESFLSSISPVLSNTVYDFEKVKSEILAKARQLQTGKYDLQLGDFLFDPQFEKDHVISEVTIQSKIAENDYNLLASEMSEIELKPMTQFSLLGKLDELEIKQVSKHALNLLATGIYQVILPTNFSIIERQISKELPNYAELGYEAKADVDRNMDLVFSNPNEATYVIKVEWKKNSVKVSLLGSSFLNQYQIKTKGKQTFKPKTIVQFNPQLTPLQKIVEEEGKEGLLIKVIRETYDENGQLLKTEEISEDFYAPIHRVEVQGLIVEEGNSSENKEQTTDDSDEETNTDTETDSGDSDESEPPITEDPNAQG